MRREMVSMVLRGSGEVLDVVLWFFKRIGFLFRELWGVIEGDEVGEWYN